MIELKRLLDLVCMRLGVMLLRLQERTSGAPDLACHSQAVVNILRNASRPQWGWTWASRSTWEPRSGRHFAIASTFAADGPCVEVRIGQWADLFLWEVVLLGDGYQWGHTGAETVGGVYRCSRSGESFQCIYGVSTSTAALLQHLSPFLGREVGLWPVRVLDPDGGSVYQWDEYAEEVLIEEEQMRRHFSPDDAPTRQPVYLHFQPGGFPRSEHSRLQRAATTRATVETARESALRAALAECKDLAPYSDDGNQSEDFPTADEIIAGNPPQLSLVTDSGEE